jgi:hypothetical protein
MDRDQMIETIRRTFETMFAELREGRVPLDHRDK